MLAEREFLISFSRISAKLNFVFNLVFFLFFDSAKAFYCSVFLCSYSLNVQNEHKHINVGVIVLYLVAIALNWASNLWINTVLAAIMSIEFLVYFVASIMYTKLTEQLQDRRDILLYSAFECNVQFLLFAILFTFDCFYFYREKNIILVLTAFFLPYYNKLHGGIFTLFLLSFILYTIQVPYFKHREPLHVVPTVAYALSLLTILDICRRFVKLIY